jgi:hypothetical protein
MPRINNVTWMSRSRRTTRVVTDDFFSPEILELGHDNPGIERRPRFGIAIPNQSNIQAFLQDIEVRILRDMEAGRGFIYPSVQHGS